MVRMSILCRGEDGSHYGWSQWIWPKLLRLAQAHGWKPLGTSQPDEELVHFPNHRWDRSNYTTNDGQIVSAEDAQALSNALEAALRQIPEHDALAKFRTADGGIPILPQAPSASDEDWFSGETKAPLVEFIAFCRHGSFRIW
jgi:hypothetical protein